MSGTTSGPARTDGAAPAQTVSLEQVLRVLRRRWGTLAAGALLGGALAGAYAAAVPPQYEATAVVTLNALLDNPLSTTGTPRLPNTATETEVVRSSQVAERVADLLEGVSAEDALAAVDVTAPVDSQALRISYSADDPRAAAVGADAFATSYLDYRSEVLQGQVEALAEELTAQVEDLEVDQLAAQSLALTAQSPVERARASGRLGSTTALIDRANEQLAQLRTAPTATGVLVGPASVPTGPAGPGLPVLLVAGVLVGLLGAALWALGRDRLDRRVVDRAQLQELVGRPVLAELATDPGARPDEAYRRLAALVAADSPASRQPARAAAGGPLHGPCVLVTRAHDDAATPTAALLALAFAEQGHATMLWCSPTALAANRALVSSARAHEAAPGGPAGAGRGAVRVECYGSEEQLAARPSVLAALRSESGATVVDGSDVAHWATPVVLAPAVTTVVVVARKGLSSTDDLRDSVADLEAASGSAAGLVLLADGGRPRRRRPAPAPGTGPGRAAGPDSPDRPVATAAPAVLSSVRRSAGSVRVPNG